MVNVVDGYKLVGINIDGETKIIKINPSDAWNVFESVVETENGKVKTTVNEGDTIQFVIEDWEIKSGIVNKITGKKEKTKIQIIPTGKDYEEIWSVVSIKEGTLKVLGKEDEVMANEDIEEDFDQEVEDEE